VSLANASLASRDRAPGDSQFTTFTKEEQVLVFARNIEIGVLLAAGGTGAANDHPIFSHVWSGRAGLVLIKEDQ